MIKPSENNNQCPKCGGCVRWNEYGVGQCSACLLVFDTRHAWEECIGESKQTRRGVLPKRFEKWYDARTRRGQRRHKKLAISPRYHNALVNLRVKYNVPPSGFLTNDECEAWTHWFNQEVDKDVQDHKRRDRCMYTRLQRDSEKLANKFKIVGDWTIVYKHMLYDTTIKLFMFDEGWQFTFDDDGRAHFDAGNATQECERHGKRLFHSQRERTKEELHKQWYDYIEYSIQSGKRASEAIMEIARDLARQENGYADDYVARVKKAYQRQKRQIRK